MSHDSIKKEFLIFILPLLWRTLLTSLKMVPCCTNDVIKNFWESASRFLRAYITNGKTFSDVFGKSTDLANKLKFQVFQAIHHGVKEHAT